jgi:hypothetical protein
MRRIHINCQSQYMSPIICISKPTFTLIVTRARQRSRNCSSLFILYFLYIPTITFTTLNFHALFRCKAIDIHLHVLKMLPRSQAVNGHDIAKLKKDSYFNDRLVPIYIDIVTDISILFVPLSFFF